MPVARTLAKTLFVATPERRPAEPVANTVPFCVSAAQNLSVCSASHLGATFDPVTSAVTRYVRGIVHDSVA